MIFLLVDTNVVSFFLKRDTRAALYAPHLAGKLPGISFQTLAELERWSLLRHWGPARIAQMRQVLQGYTIYWADAPRLCAQWAGVYQEAYAKGRPIEPADAWIAATALLHQLPLMTHNPRHFDFLTGLTLITEAP